MPITILREGSDAALTAFGRRVSLPMDSDGSVRLFVVVDRTSIEIFAQDGQVTLSGYHLAAESDRHSSWKAEGGVAKVLFEGWSDLKSALPSQ